MFQQLFFCIVFVKLWSVDLKLWTTRDNLFGSDAQVTSGGNFDIDVTLRDPLKNPIKVLQREQYDFFDYTARMDGEYEVSS